jgi:hypothetical protein
LYSGKKTVFVELSDLLISFHIGIKPGVESVCIVDVLMTRKCGQTCCLEVKTIRLSIRLCLMSIPLRGLKAAPSGSQCNQGYDNAFQDLDCKL